VEAAYSSEMLVSAYRSTWCCYSEDQHQYKIPHLQTTVESRLSDLTGNEGQSDNQKCWIMQKSNEKDEGTYQLSLWCY
jgi:hypothetical protein